MDMDMTQIRLNTGESKYSENIHVFSAHNVFC